MICLTEQNANNNCKRDGKVIYSLKVAFNLEIYLALIGTEKFSMITKQKHEFLLSLLFVHH